MSYENMDKETLIKVLKPKDDMLKALCLEKEKLTYYANTDTMTEVLNRRAGLELLDRKLHLSKACGESFVICFVDVDRLKLINDTFGHEEGDKLLINAAKILRGSIRFIRPNIIHLMRGEINEFQGKKIFCFGGANSTDKEWRIEGKSWWKEEFPNEFEKIMLLIT